LKKKIFIALIIIFAGACVFLFHIFYEEAKNTAITKLNEEQMIHAKQAARGIEDFFATWTRDLNSLSKMDEIISTDAVGKRYMKLFYEAHQEQVFSITRLDERGTILYNFPSGNSIGTDISGQKHIRELLKHHNLVISDVFRAVEGFEAVALHVPIFRGSVFKGSIGILINFESIAKRYLDVIRIGKTGNAWVVSRDGTQLYSPIPGFIGKSVFENTKDSPALNATVNDMLKGHEGTAIYSFDRIGDRNAGQIRKYAVYMPVHIGNTFWSIAVASAEQDVLSGLISFRRKLVFVIGVLFICGMVFSTLGAKAWLIVKEEEKRKRVEIALQASEDRWATTLASIGDAVIATDTSGSTMFMNAVAEGLTGWTLGDALQNPIGEVFHIINEQTRLEVENPVAKVLREGTIMGLANRTLLMKKDGTEVPIDNSGAPIRDKEGKTQGVVLVFRDVTERRRMEIRLQKAAEEWQATFDSVRDLVMVLDRDYRVVRVNAATKAFVGLPVEKILGSTCHALMHGTEGPVEACPSARMRQSGKHEETELYDETRHAWFRVSSDPIFDEKGEIRQIVHSVQDITEQKKEEVERFTARRELLRTERLLRMGELTASLAHELNQPLTSILCNAGAALVSIRSDRFDMVELTEILEDIVDDDKRAGDIIRSLRSMVTPGESEPELVAINDVLRQVVALFNSESIMRRIKVDMDFADPLPRVNIDRVQLQQVAINLMMNAADSMMNASKNRRIVIRTQMADDGGVLVAIRDFGSGIDEKDLAMIFEPFFTTKRSGLGMGLSLSRSIIEGHGGHIRAENNSDGGSTFCFDLPGARESK
jgi:two-component system, cell cycle sensor histidine kinase and response regulator CckA